MTLADLSPVGLAGLDHTELRAARGLAARLLADDGVTYTPPPSAGSLGSSRARRWRLDPLPAVIEATEWERVERGVVQRVELHEAILADLYGPRRLLSAGLIPPELLWRHDGHLRQAWGAQPSRTPRLLIAATDLGRTQDGQWQVFGDRTQAPSGIGYAMENRRVIARVLPEAYRQAEPRRLSTFFNQLRDAVVEVAPRAVEDPRVVVLTPGRHSETAFDHAFLASLLGFPLVTGTDLVTRDGRLFMRELDKLRQVDVLVRRVDDTWCDPLELRPDSELGVPGLLETVRRGAVTMANSFGVGAVESVAFHPLLPKLAESVLGETLRLGSARAWWCGEPAGLSHALANLDSMAIRPLSRSEGRGGYGPALSQEQADQWRRRIQADPAGYVAQEVLDLDLTPVVSGSEVVSRPMTYRVFSLTNRDSYTVMPGALGMVLPESPANSSAEVALTKDVWVRPSLDAVLETERERIGLWSEGVTARGPSTAMVPRALEDLFWLGRYTERVEDNLRLLLALHGLDEEFPPTNSGPGQTAVGVLTAAVRHVTDTPPVDALVAGPGPAEELGLLLLDSARVGSVAQGLEALRGSANSVRDQLSADVFLVLGSVERAQAGLAEEQVAQQPQQAAAQMLSGMLALAGIYADNMIRDVGWQLLEAGRALERVMQTIMVLRELFGPERAPAVEYHLVAACLIANESVLTHRRRYGGAQYAETLLELLVSDKTNPRSIAFGIGRLAVALTQLPGLARTSRAWRLVDELRELVDQVRSVDLTRSVVADGDGESLFSRARPELIALTEQLDSRLRALNDALADRYFAQTRVPQPLGVLRIDPRSGQVGPESGPESGPGLGHGAGQEAGAQP